MTTLCSCVALPPNIPTASVPAPRINLFSAAVNFFHPDGQVVRLNGITIHDGASVTETEDPLPGFVVDELVGLLVLDANVAHIAYPLTLSPYNLVHQSSHDEHVHVLSFFG